MSGPEIDVADGDTVRVRLCDADETLAGASDLFNQYRHHYGQPPDDDGRTLGWLTDMVRSDMLMVWTATARSPAVEPPIGMATGHAIPASLAMGCSWQLRDLYVLPGSRRRGAATALVGAVRTAARTAGATRLSLFTEEGNHAALDFYRRLGFEPVEGLTSLSVDLGSSGPCERSPQREPHAERIGREHGGRCPGEVGGAARARPARRGRQGARGARGAPLTRP